MKQDGSVAEFGTWTMDSWRWKFQWSRNLSEEELNNEALLLDTLSPISLDSERNDRWVWTMDNSTYKVKSVYNLLLEKCEAEPIEAEVLNAVKKVWKVAAPSKFIVHAWRLLLNRVPTREALPSNSCRSVVEHFQQHGMHFKRKKKKGVKHLIWVATVWVLWINRNSHFQWWGSKCIKHGRAYH